MRAARLVLLAALCLSPASCFNSPDVVAQDAFDRGRQAFAAGDFAAADAHFSAAVRTEPAFARAYGGRARARVALGRPREALADLDQQQRLDPAAAGPALLVYRAAVRAGLSEYDAALGDCAAALKADPTNDEAHYLAGQVHWAAGRAREACVELEEAARLDTAWRGELERYGKGGAPSLPGPEGLRKSAAALY
jgi:tetratricopeptide (TPR) repeat protein